MGGKYAKADGYYYNLYTYRPNALQRTQRSPWITPAEGAMVLSTTHKATQYRALANLQIFRACIGAFTSIRLFARASPNVLKVIPLLRCAGHTNLFVTVYTNNEMTPDRNATLDLFFPKVYPINSLWDNNKKPLQLLLGWPTVLPHNLNPNPKPITNWFLNFAHHYNVGMHPSLTENINLQSSH